MPLSGFYGVRFSNNAEPKRVKDQQRSRKMADIMGTFVKIISVLVAFSLFLGSSAENLALKRPIEANFTCGSPPEIYYKTWQDQYRPNKRRQFTCNASDAIDSHPPSRMVDANFDTYWQSKAGMEITNITIDLRSETQKFIFVRTINITFEAYQRPGQILYLKSSDGGVTFTPWHRYVSFPFECQSVFGVTFAERPFLVKSVLCKNYLELLPSKGNQSVFVDLYGGRSSTNSPQLQEWLNATHIRMRFSGLFKKFDIFSKNWHHYAVREIKVTGSCFCNGHASGCTINSTTGARSCQCRNNACGPLCDRCCPAFNQYPWKQGTGAPFEHFLKKVAEKESLNSKLEDPKISNFPN
ncbi:laminin subunit alpha-1-like [Rhopilema esculentum]|uniref:laminin subunit alpha-1-like n=1 Tax=Rhopilema esculentum TaxID=499914 RepID=UPI0031E02DE5